MKQINLEEISILQMQIFITAANELNYTRTANICNVTQPTVSRSIDALEKNTRTDFVLQAFQPYAGNFGRESYS